MDGDKSVNNMTSTTPRIPGGRVYAEDVWWISALAATVAVTMTVAHTSVAE